MRRFLRLIFVFIMSVITLVTVTFLIAGLKDVASLSLLFVAAGGAVFILSYKSLFQEYRVLFWLSAIPLSGTLMLLALAGGLGIFFSSMFFTFMKGIVATTSWAFWYGISLLIIKPSRDEKLRQTETPSETALRHAQERRDPAFDIAERERLNKILASLPEAKRQALLKKQKEYEECQEKKFK